MSDSDLPLLNIYEIEMDGVPRHLIGFLDPVRAGASGIDSRAMVGEFEPGPDGEFDLETFEVNPEFIEAYTQYMNGPPSISEPVVSEAKALRSQWLYLVDPRNATPADEDPPAYDVLGCYAVDDSGQVVPNSFQYNVKHELFSLASGVSGLFTNQDFYRWLHDRPAPHAHDEALADLDDD